MSALDVVVNLRRRSWPDWHGYQY